MFRALHWFAGWLSRLKPLSKAVFLAEMLDLAMTLWAIYLMPQLWESNPMQASLGGWGQTIMVKLAATGLIVFTLERVKKWPPLVQLVPLAAALPVIWNVVIILAELITKS